MRASHIFSQPLEAIEMAAAAFERFQRIHPTLEPAPVFKMPSQIKNEVDVDEAENSTGERVLILKSISADGSVTVTELPEVVDAGYIQAMNNASKPDGIEPTPDDATPIDAQATLSQSASRYPDTPMPFVHFAVREKRFSHLFQADPFDPLVQRSTRLLPGTPPKPPAPCELKVKTCTKPTCAMHVLQTPPMTILRNSLASLMPHVLGALKKEQQFVENMKVDLMCNSVWDDAIQPLYRRTMGKAKEYHDLSMRLLRMIKQEVVARKIKEAKEAREAKEAQAAQETQDQVASAA